MINWQEGNVTVADGVRLHYYRAGEGSPLVLAHGAGDSGRCWDRVASTLATRFDVLAYDARYHGESDAPEGGSLAGGDDLIAVVEALGLHRPVIMGHSMGGRSVAQAAASRSALFRCAILEDPPWWATRPEIGRAPTDLSAMRIDQIEAFGRQLNPGWHPDEFPAWAQSKQQFRPPEGWIRSFGSETSWRDLLPGIAIPVLLLRGGNAARGAIVTAEVAAEAARLAPDMEVVTLQEAGHNVRREAFDGYVRAVREFLAKHK